VNEVLIKLAADSAALVAGLNKGKDALTRFEGGIDKVRDKLGLLAGVAGISWLVSFAKATIDEADALNDLSKRTGASVRDLASLKLAAEQNGTSLDDLAKSMGKLNLSFSQGMNGSKEQAESLNNLKRYSASPSRRWSRYWSWAAKVCAKWPMGPRPTLTRWRGWPRKPIGLMTNLRC
jgi:hypothetical protein